MSTFGGPVEPEAQPNSVHFFLHIFFSPVEPEEHGQQRDMPQGMRAILDTVLISSDTTNAAAAAAANFTRAGFGLTSSIAKTRPFLQIVDLLKMAVVASS